MRKGKRQHKGLTTIEFAIIAPVFIFLVFSTVDMCTALWVNLTMQYAVREGARYSVTGQSSLDPTTADTSNQQRYLAVVEAIKGSSMGVYQLVSPVYTITINGTESGTFDDSSSYTAGMFGVEGDIVVIKIHCSWPLMTPFMDAIFTDGKYSFDVAATMKNEAF